MSIKPLIIGIDASNLLRGGGITHLLELLGSAKPSEVGIGQIVVWGGLNTLNALIDRSWLDKRNPPELNKGLIYRSLWQRFKLSQAARDAHCDVLFVPGGSYAGNFHPVVTMSRNMLPFEWRELKRYGWSFFTLKLLILRLIQARSYQNADGLIFLTNYAREATLRIINKSDAKIATIPHGLNRRFNQKPRQQQVISDYDFVNPYRILYVSTIDQYKHQWMVVEAISILRKEGFPVALDLVGPSYTSALKRLNKTIVYLNGQSWVNYHGTIPFNELHSCYALADLGIFASSCENMPNILLETMASGLPIACSNRGPMPEVLADGGVYFDPEQPDDIARVLRELIMSPQLRFQLANIAYQRAQKFSWERCATMSLEFLFEVSRLKDLDHV